MTQDPSFADVSASVRQLLGLHAHAQDAGRTDDVVALYTPDAELEFPGQDPVVGGEAIRAAFDGWAPQAPQLHVVANTVVTEWSATTASARSDVVFVSRGDAGWEVRIVGRYEDRFVLTEDGWRLTRRAAEFQ